MNTQTKLKANRRQKRGAKTACRSAALVSEWEFYGVPEATEASALLSSRAKLTPQTQPVGAVRETLEGIEILFFPHSV